MRLVLNALLLALVSPAWAVQAPVAEPLTVMSFNIRYGTANDGENRWENRRDMLLALMRAENADLIGVQEALYSQIRFTLSDAATFWFSDTPEVVASTSWGNTITRICSWARFIDRDGRAFWHYNVHLPRSFAPPRTGGRAMS